MADDDVPVPPTASPCIELPGYQLAVLDSQSPMADGARTTRSWPRGYATAADDEPLVKASRAARAEAVVRVVPVAAGTPAAAGSWKDEAG